MSIPYWRLSIFYFCYFATLGAMVPYWPVYLQQRGFGPEAIGLLTAVMMLARVIAPYVWGWLADRAAQRMNVVQHGALLAMIFFACVFINDQLWWFALLLLIHSFFWNALLAQFEVVTLDYLGPRPQDYTRIRLWGSVGFIATVAGAGALFDVIAMRWLPVMVLLSMVLVWCSSLSVQDAPRHLDVSTPTQSIAEIIRKPEVICFFIACCLMQVSHGPYYTFFSLYMEHHGHSRAVVGQLWALGVLAEVVLFGVMYRLLPRWGIRFFLLLSLALASLRWLLLALFPEKLWLLLFAQCLHAFSFGAFHASAIELVRRFFSARQAGRGQALYNAIGYGIGNVAGALMSGYLWAWSNRWTFLAAALASFLGFLVAWKGLRGAST